MQLMEADGGEDALATHLFVLQVAATAVLWPVGDPVSQREPPPFTAVGLAR